MMDSRRSYLKIIGAVGATCAFPFQADELYGQEAHQHGGTGPAPKVPPFEPKFFTAAEGLVVARLADVIIPRTDTPGAVDAGVPQYIDMVVSRSAQLQKQMRDGLAWVDNHAQQTHGKKFLELSPEEQTAMAQALSDVGDTPKTNVAPEVDFFRSFKSLTADGYYTSYAGLVQELGYKGNQALATFAGCVHEH
jgi:hypothetical protein